MSVGAAAYSLGPRGPEEKPNIWHDASDLHFIIADFQFIVGAMAYFEHLLSPCSIF